MRSPNGRASATAASAARRTTRRPSSARSAPTAEFYDPYQENAKRWYKYSQERMPFVNHAIIHPPVDRDRPPNEVADVCVHIEKETDAGIIVSGAKVVATGSVLTNYTFVAHHGLMPLGDKNFAVVFMIPTNAPGVKLICRTSFEMTATAMGSPFDYPLSSRLDENDAVFILDNVLVPWENVFVYRRRGEGQQLLPAHRLPAALAAAWLHAPRGEARFHRRAVPEGGRGRRHEGLPRRAGEGRRGDRLAQPVLGPLRRHGARSEAVDRRIPAAEHGPGSAYQIFCTIRLLEDQIHHRADGRLRADLPELSRARFRQRRRSAPISTAICAARTATRRRSG